MTAETRSAISFARKVLNYIRPKEFDPTGKSLLLAVSGGMDSMALLHFWNTAGREAFGCSVSAAHVDHGLRDNSEDDRQFVEQHCRALGVPVHFRRLDPAERAAGVSVEMWGREARYRFFRELTEQNGFDWILTAHHMDDQLETLLLRISRGTTLRGLQGIFFRRQPNIIRPFLCLRRSEILEYAREESLVWREDPSNADQRFTRNRIRHSLIPEMIRSEPDAAESAFRCAEIMQETWPLFAGELGGLIMTDGESGDFIPEKTFRTLAAEDNDRCFMLVSLLAEKQEVYLTEGVFQELLRQNSGGGSHHIKVQVGDDIELVLKSGQLRFIAMKAPETAEKTVYQMVEIPMTSESVRVEACFGKEKIEVYANRFPKPAEYEIIRQKSRRVHLDFGKISGPLAVRHRCNGDKFSPLGIVAEKRKLKEYFIGIKYPLEERDELILVCIGNEVVWIPGFEISEFYKVTSATQEILELELK